MAYINSHERLLRSLEFGDEDYSGHALRAVKRIVESQGGVWAFLQIPKLNEWLARERPAAFAVLEQIATQVRPQLAGQARRLLVLVEGIRQTFTEEDWIRLGIIASCSDLIEGHPRLLRSLRFGDDDYEGCVIEILGLMEQQGKRPQEALKGFQKFRDWLLTNHADVAQALLGATASNAVASSASRGSQILPSILPSATQPVPTSPPSVLAQPVPASPPAVLAQPVPASPPAVLAQPVSPVPVTPTLFGLMDMVRAVAPGPKSASEYHQAIVRLLSELFASNLSAPTIEDRLHEGRKRVDITYVNRDRSGFFHWIATHYPPAPYVYVECKNYSADPGNPEIDQLTGRFSTKRGRIGLLVCRGFTDKELFLKRCRDSALDDRGYVVPLDDPDLAELVAAKVQEGDEGVFRALMLRWNRLVK